MDFNHMSDWTEYEYRRIMGVYQEDEMFGPLDYMPSKPIETRTKLTIFPNFNLTVDWREVTNAPKKQLVKKNKNVKGVSVITPVKD